MLVKANAKLIPDTAEMIIKKRNEEGIALLITLFVLTLVVTIILEFDFTTRLNSKMAANFRDTQKALLLLESAVQAGRALFQLDTEASFDSEDEIWATPVPGWPVGDGSVTLRMVDEDRKLDVNSIVNVNAANKNDSVNTKNKDILKRLLETIIMEEEGTGLEAVTVDELVDSIADWLDSNDEPNPYGAESTYYLSLEEPVNIKNAPMDSISELKLVKGFENLTIGGYETLKQYLTVYPRQNPQNVKININTAPWQVIAALHQDMTEEEAKRVVENRNNTDNKAYTSSDDLKNMVGEATKNLIINNVVFTSRYYRLFSSINVGDITRNIEVVYDRTINRANDVIIN